jgi:geranylgeranyl transferase type-2 subunit beta
LRSLHRVDVAKAVTWIRKCQNVDGAFGAAEGCESHAGQVLTSVGALVLADAIGEINKDGLGLWFSEKQDPMGSCNGRPEKLPTSAPPGGHRRGCIGVCQVSG